MIVSRKLGIAFAILLFACGPALANPALWVVKSPTATVYLFGTIHVLPKGVHWHYPLLDRALAASGSLYVEEDDSSRSKMTTLILKYGVNPLDRANLESLLEGYPVYRPYILDGRPSSYMAPPINATKLNMAARRADLPVATLKEMRPWIAALALSVASTDSSGYQPQFGADTEIEREFKADHKPVHSFETTREQIDFFADLPLPTQLELLQTVLDQRTRGTVQAAELARDWQGGDTSAIADAVLSQMRNDHPEVYEVLLLDRNRKWAQQIADLLKQHGTVFVAVGAGHLTGPGSVQAQLDMLGIKTLRLH
ncbi:MAG TPA: TraB/GumN family protein [Rhodanobacteraceae bacterium]|nr:TraB/GumN family protein [Rhodanobacteraceae bacterium]